jgi:outer membrane protein, multidrug efflux system
VATQAVTAKQIAARRTKQDVEVHANDMLVGTAQARMRQGTQDARQSLMAQAQLLQQRDQAVSLHAQALSTDLALIKALGGGYRSDIAHDAPPAAAASSSTASLSHSDGATAP